MDMEITGMDAKNNVMAGRFIVEKPKQDPSAFFKDQLGLEYSS